MIRLQLRLPGLSAIKIAQLAQRNVVPLSSRDATPQDDVVQDLDFQQLSCTNQIPRHPDIGLGRRGIPTRVIVYEDNRGGVGRDGRREDLHAQGFRSEPDHVRSGRDRRGEPRHRGGVIAGAASGRHSPPGVSGGRA